MTKTVLFVCVLSLALMGCGKEKKAGVQDLNAGYSYSYTENGCDTGVQNFDSKQALCDGLQDEKLNKRCARALRKIAYENECVGIFTPKNLSRLVH